MKKYIVIVSIALLIVISISIYWFYYSKPSSFLTDKQLMDEINEQLSSRAAASRIQDTIFLDERHVVVPFISENQSYGYSLWIWKNHIWKLAYIDPQGAPNLWKLNIEDPNTYHIIWNIPPQKELSQLKFFLINDQSYTSFGNNPQYHPKVQMEITNQRDNTFGVIKLPKEWAKYMEMYLDFSSTTSSLHDFPNYFQTQSVFVGWHTYNTQEQITYPEGIINVDNIHMEEIDLEYIIFLDESMLEFPSE